MKKWVFRGIFAFVGLVVAILVLAWVYLDSIVKRGVEKVGPAITKTDVRLDGVSLSLFSGRGEVKGLVVGNPEGFKSPSAIQVQSAGLAIQPGSVLGDKVVVRFVKLMGPQITFEGGLKGNNLNKLLENVQGTKEKPSDTKEEQKANTRKLQVDEFVISGAKVNVVADFLGGKAMAVNLPEIRLSNLGQGPEGITPAELTEKVLREVLEQTLKAVAGAGADVANFLKGVGTGTATNATGQLKDAAKGIGDLFKKKKE